jgi:hypothetical protein
MSLTKAIYNSRHITEHLDTVKSRLASRGLSVLELQDELQERLN